MAQLKVYGRREVWAGQQRQISDLLHECLISAWKLPQDKRFHRFHLMDVDDFICPQRGDNYLIVEVLCFTGRTDTAKRELIHAVYDRLVPGLDLSTDDLEVTIIDMPKANWGIRGVPADDLTLAYSVDL